MRSIILIIIAFLEIISGINLEKPCDPAIIVSEKQL